MSGTTNGCTSTLVNAEVIVNPLPTINLGADTILQQGSTVTLSANNGLDLSYLWSNGAITADISVAAMGTYSVTVTNSAACTASDEIVVTIISSTQQAIAQVNIVVAPNPTQTEIRITCTGASMESLHLMDPLGKSILHENLSKKDGEFYKLQLENLPAGTYFVRILGNDFSRTIPVVKY